MYKELSKNYMVLESQLRLGLRKTQTHIFPYNLFGLDHIDIDIVYHNDCYYPLSIPLNEGFDHLDNVISTTTKLGFKPHHSSSARELMQKFGFSMPTTERQLEILEDNLTAILGN